MKPSGMDQLFGTSAPSSARPQVESAQAYRIAKRAAIQAGSAYATGWVGRSAYVGHVYAGRIYFARAGGYYSAPYEPAPSGYCPGSCACAHCRELRRRARTRALVQAEAVASLENDPTCAKEKDPCDPARG